MCRRTVTDLRGEPDNHAERLSQVLMGEGMRILERGESWDRVRLERDGYHGWVHQEAIHPCTREDFRAYAASCQARVLAELLLAQLEPTAGEGSVAGKLPFGVRLPVTRKDRRHSQVRLPDGRTWWVESAGLLPVELWPTPTSAGIAFTLALFKRMVGTPYLWGGRTPYGFDCSGLSSAFWDFLGITLPRDSHQQFETGEPVQGELLPGDLLFFGSVEQDPSGTETALRDHSVTHVAISLGGDEVLHANGTDWGVSLNSLHPASQHYRAWLREKFVGARRYR
jgi:cell wall-associated NlpC family hydrolase